MKLGLKKGETDWKFWRDFLLMWPVGAAVVIFEAYLWDFSTGKNWSYPFWKMALLLGAAMVTSLLCYRPFTMWAAIFTILTFRSLVAVVIYDPRIGLLGALLNALPLAITTYVARRREGDSAFRRR